MKHRAWWAALISIAAGVALQWMYMRRFEVAVSGGEPTRVLVAARDLKANDVLTPSSLAARVIPAAYVDQRNIRVSDSDAVDGQPLAAAVHAGETLLWSDLRVDPLRGRALADRVRPGMRATTLHAGDERGFAELLQPGDSVDVLLTTNAPASGSPSTSNGWTETLLQNVLVLAVGSDLGATNTERGQRESRARHVTVSVSPPDAQRLAHAQRQGQLSLTLRHPDDALLLDTPPHASTAAARANANTLVETRTPPVTPASGSTRHVH